MGKLDGKVAVITGGASGIGEATVRLFVDEGCRVVVADVLDERGRRLVDGIGKSAVYVHADVSQETQVRAAVEHAVSHFGRLDCVFNNAGLAGVSGPIAEIPVDGFDRTIGILLRGVFLGMKHAAPIMKRQGTGSIVSTASVAGLQAGFGPHVYSAAKAAVIHLTRSVAMELGESGVRVNCICPGGIATPIFGKALGLDEAAADEAAKKMETVLSTHQPIQRAGLPEDIAQAALWLASDGSRFVTGHALVVDGGLTGGRMWSVVQEQRAMLRAFLGADT
ncbi:MAG TPA: glucose 1-dehydrogenase [Candidatus Dormibacteraeota bacterium]|jgi:NAD(P)-dependent dehydrogenase (short-subunit alcohol dehydrogenase family)|nr:glucose 1-dehydrogenase [Candidatus Dormibacteraeota bacterium]